MSLGQSNISSGVGCSFGELGAVQISEGLRAGRWSSVELTEYFLSRIAELNSGIHAMVGIEAEMALRQAAAADARRAAGKSLGDLDGMPMTVKDAFRMQGYLSTYGFRMFKNYRPRNDCRVVEVLRNCGVVFIGRTAVPTGSFDWNCRNQVHEECVNPFDSTRTPGGSSGGAAAALATGMTPLELGSDFHGSLRYPAHCCGIYSLRTTDGWLPVEDIGPEQFPATFRRIATCGPMARNLEDLQLMLAAFEAAFPLQAISMPAKTDRKPRIAYARGILGLKPDRATGGLLDDLLRKLEARGCEMTEVSPDVNWDSLYEDMGIIGGYEFSSVFPRLLRMNWIKSAYARVVFQSRIGTGAFMTHFRRGMLASIDQYQSALQRQQDVFSGVERFFSGHDAWMLPVSPSAAIPRDFCGKKISTEQGEIEYLRYLGSYLGPTAMLGTPALTVPVGHNENGLPVAVQIHGPRFSDRRLVQMVADCSI